MNITWTDVTIWLTTHGIRILLILILGVIFWILLQKLSYPFVHRFLVETKGESKEGIKKRTDTIVGIIRGVGRILIALISLLMVLDEVGVPIATVLAGLGIGGIALGFGAQWLIKDIIAGLCIIAENQYRVGDVVNIAGIGGLVEEITLRKTVLRDLDGICHNVPNGEIKVASNFTRHFSRVNLNISVAYDTNLDHAIKVINQVGKELAEADTWRDRIISLPQVLRVDKLGESGIDIKIIGDVKPSQQWAVMGELRLRLKKAFDKEGIEIPWPHTKVYFGNTMPGSKNGNGETPDENQPQST